MTKELWLNLPVKDVARSRAFYKAIGFTIHPQHEQRDDMTGLVMGEKQVMVMLFPEASFKNFARHEVADTRQGSEILISIDAESREEVDAFALKVKEANGHIFAAPGEKDGWMYGFGFSDPDGHRWNMLHMDTSKLPQD